MNGQNDLEKAAFLLMMKTSWSSLHCSNAGKHYRQFTAAVDLFIKQNLRSSILELASMLMLV